MYEISVIKFYVRPVTIKSKVRNLTWWQFSIFYYLLGKRDELFIGRSSHPEMFLGKAVLKLCSKFTGKHPCWSVISIKLLCNFIELLLRHGCSLLNLLHIFRTPFYKNGSGELLLQCAILFTNVTKIFFKKSSMLPKKALQGRLLHLHCGKGWLDKQSYQENIYDAVLFE